MKKKTNLPSVLEKLNKEILSIETMTDLTLNFVENIADPLMNDVLSAIPIVSTMKGIVKTGIQIRDRLLLKKTLLFMGKLASHDVINDMRFKNYREALQSNSKKNQEEMERIILILDKFDDVNKSKLIANGFYYYLIEKIDSDEFFEMISILDFLVYKDIELVRKLMNGESQNFTDSEKVSLKRLVATGVSENLQRNGGTLTLDSYSLTVLGKNVSWYLLESGTPPKK